MSLYRSRSYTITAETCGHVIVSQSSWIKPIFQRCHRPVMFEWSSVPKTFQRRDLVIPGASASVECQVGVGIYRHVQDIICHPVLIGYFESCHGCQHVICIQRRRMTDVATLSHKNFPTSLS